jgi:hypothetical protein
MGKRISEEEFFYCEKMGRQITIIREYSIDRMSDGDEVKILLGTKCDHQDFCGIKIGSQYYWEFCVHPELKKS